MNEIYESKKYEPYKIPIRENLSKPVQVPNSMKSDAADFNGSNKFVEIEISGGRNYILETMPQVIEPVIDDKRKIFAEMRQIARDGQFKHLDQSKMIYNYVHRIEFSKMFYRQAVFMKDFEDSYAEQAAFSSYFPHYQIMSYEQLRTYFTWRTNVRKGYIANIPVSYAFLYIYELLNNIGINDPMDGMNQLTAFWTAFKPFDGLIDKYLTKWVKDYYIYYNLPTNSGLQPDNNDSVELFCGISKYDIKNSVFYTGENRELIENCISFTINIIKQKLTAAGINFDDLIFQSRSNKSAWRPFDSALFYPRTNQSDRKAMLSKDEIYIYRQNKWLRMSVSDGDGNKHLTGYILKQTESALRKITGYKRKLSASLNMLDRQTVITLREVGFNLEKEINDAVYEFYTIANRKVVSIDMSALDKIRRDAMDIQEILLNEDIKDVKDNNIEKVEPIIEICSNQIDEISVITQPSDHWTSFKQALTEPEMDALRIIINDGSLKLFSGEIGIMPEVLIDSINQKAYDAINDTVLDFGDDVTVFDEYRDKLIEMVMN